MTALQIDRLLSMDKPALRVEWQKVFGSLPPSRLSVRFMQLALGWQVQAKGSKGFSRETTRALRQLKKQAATSGGSTDNDAQDQVHEGQHEPILSDDLWNRVQAQLRKNRIVRHHASNAHHPSLLTGLLYDRNGNRFHPRHANKQSRRYRYYVSTTRSIPAHEVETATTQQLATFIRSHDCLDLITQYHQQRSDWEKLDSRRTSIAQELTTHPPRPLLQRLISRITLTTDRLSIHLSKPALCSLLEQGTDPGQAVDANSQQTTVDTDCALADSRQDHHAPDARADTHILTCDVHLKRSGQGKRLILHSDGQSTLSQPDPYLLKAIGRAHLWFDDLKAGKSFKEIAITNKIDQRHVARTIQLVFLAPDITQSILDGSEPEGMTAAKLQRITDLPIHWDEQRSLLQDL